MPRQLRETAERLGGLHRREIVPVPLKAVVYCRNLILDNDFIGEEIARLSGENEDTNKIELFRAMLLS